MAVITRQRVALVFICSMFATTASADAYVDIQQMLKGIQDECRDYTRVLVDAEWASIERSNRTDDFSNDFKESLSRVRMDQCVLTQQLLIFEMLQKEISKDEWNTLGGTRSFQQLREKLIKTFPY